MNWISGRSWVLVALSLAMWGAVLYGAHSEEIKPVAGLFYNGNGSGTVWSLSGQGQVLTIPKVSTCEAGWQPVMTAVGEWKCAQELRDPK